MNTVEGTRQNVSVTLEEGESKHICLDIIYRGRRLYNRNTDLCKLERGSIKIEACPNMGILNTGCFLFNYIKLLV